MNEETLSKFRSCFGSMAVYKDLKQNNFFATLGLPSFMRDWLLQRYQDENGCFDQEEVMRFVRQFIPTPQDWTSIKDRIVVNYERVRLLAKICIDINIVTGEITFSLPDFGLSNQHTMIDADVWEACKGDLVSGQETWGLLELGYRPPDERAKPKRPGKIKLLTFRNFCPYDVSLDYYQEVRSEFTIDEWIDIVLGAIDYNAHGFSVAKEVNQMLVEVKTMKLTMLTRLLPFLEKRLNLVELAPKGTGKSYIFGQISRYGWLSTSDRMTRAKLFYDMSKREGGLVMQNDFVVLDEVQKTLFDEGMGSTMQGYLEQGTFTVGNYSGSADAGMILCGNIAPEIMDADGRLPMFTKLPKIFHDPAIIDRFHGIIKGWHIPRMNDDLKVAGWALNSEYFTAILHLLRNEGAYRALVDSIVLVPSGADTRDTEAVKRIATAYLKLLFPDATSLSKVSGAFFERYCLSPAMKMRYTIKCQLSQMDRQYKEELPDLRVKK